MLNLNDMNLLRTEAFIAGNWIDVESGETFAVKNPVTGLTIAEVARSGKDETILAINAAQHAFQTWRHTTAKERFSYLMAWHDLLLAHVDDLALLLTTEQGKPLEEARGEIIYGANYVRWFAEEAKRIYGDTIPQPSNDKRQIVIKQPIGVVACITPWNFPNAMLARKIAPALAAGNTVVCKAANETPLSALAMAELARRAGIPAGVINMVNGKTAEIGEEITSNSLVRKLTFTGSTPVGKKLTADCAKTMKRTSMELGGNAPFIVFDDADIEEAVSGLMISKFRNAGQTCVCTNRVFVQAGVYDQFLAALTIAVSGLKMGDGAIANTQIGPLIHEQAATNVQSLIKDAKDNGAQVIAKDVATAFGENFVVPTLLTNVNRDMRVFEEEIFGPVAPLFKFETEAEVIALANDTPFGLAAYFYTRDIGRVWRVSEALEYGMIGTNTGAISNEMAPFGGIKESGQGREGSKYGLDDYLEIKSICMGGLNT